MAGYGGGGPPGYDGFDHLPEEEDDDMFTSRALTPHEMTLTDGNAVENFFNSLGGPPDAPTRGGPSGMMPRLQHATGLA